MVKIKRSSKNPYIIGVILFILTNILVFMCRNISESTLVAIVATIHAITINIIIMILMMICMVLFYMMILSWFRLIKAQQEAIQSVKNCMLALNQYNKSGEIYVDL